MNAIIRVSNTSIRNTNGLYSLNDLHKASGGEKRHEITNWLKLQQTTELIEELSKPGISGLEQNQQVIKVVRGGNKSGTFVCKELVYAYAAWISPKFFLQVIRTYDAVLSGGLKRIESYTAKTTVPQREGLREAVHYLVGKRHLNFNEAYKLVHQRFNVHSIEELPAEQLPQAVQYVHALALDTSLHGEVLDALHPPAAPQGYTLSHGEELALNATFCYLQQSVETNRTLFPILEAMGSKFLPPVYDAAFETGFAIGGLTRLRQHCHQTEVDLRQRLGI